jgi:fructokinase
MRIGIDLGGTKVEAIAIDDRGVELVRHRVQTPRCDYDKTLNAINSLVTRIELKTNKTGTVGVGIPGCISGITGLVKNSNCTWINGRPFQKDLNRLLERDVRIDNDANCFAVSEATDGAAAGKAFVFGIILGTGCGGGIAIRGQSVGGANGVGGEWGHNPLPWPTAEECLGPKCYCGKQGCLEQWISGTGIERDYEITTGTKVSAREIIAAFEAGEQQANLTIDRFTGRLARGLSHVINLLDPDVIVIGGRVSNFKHLYHSIPAKLSNYVFGSEVSTPVVQAVHGDSSGVRGAAWLWPK